MKKINDIMTAAISKALCEMKEDRDSYCGLYAAWKALRQIKGFSLYDALTFDQWMDTVEGMMTRMHDWAKGDDMPERFRFTETMNVRVTAFVMGGLDGEEYETSVDVSITSHTH